MRIDLIAGGQRPWFLRLLFKLMRRRLGMVPGPMLAMTYRPALVPRTWLGRYFMRGMAGVGSWSRSEAELFAAFVSNLNTCHF